MPELDHTPDAEERENRLRNDLIAWLATVRADGRPHLVPVWFLWTGHELIVTAEPESRKVKNLSANPNLSVALDDAQGGKSPVLLEGTATIEPVSEESAVLRAYFAKYRETMREMNWTEAESRKSHSILVRIKIERFLTF